MRRALAIPWLLCAFVVVLALVIAGCAKPSLKPVVSSRALEAFAFVRRSDDRVILLVGMSSTMLCEHARTVWEKNEGGSYASCRPAILDLGGLPNIHVAVGYNPNVAHLANQFSFIGADTQADCDLLRAALTQHTATTYGWSDVPCRPAALTIR